MNLDLGCGYAPQPGFQGVDIRRCGDNIVHDLETFPWPFPEGYATNILCSHLLEHLKPWLIIEFMNEAWRVLKPDGSFLVATPYAGSYGAFQDPTHVHPGFNEATWQYFDPRALLWTIYKPKPFFIEHMTVDRSCNIQVHYRCVKPGSKDIDEEVLNTWLK